MKEIIKKIDKNRDILTNYFSGIVTVQRNLEDDDFCTLIDYLGKEHPRIGVIDKDKRLLNTKYSYIIATSIWEVIGEVLHFSEKGVTTGKANVLRFRPDCIIFKQFISKENVNEVIKLLTFGHRIIAFTNLDENEFTQLLQTNKEVSDVRNKLILEKYYLK